METAGRPVAARNAHHAGGHRGKERLRAAREQRLAAGGAQRSPNPYAYAPTAGTSGNVMDTTTVDTPRLRTHCWVQGHQTGEPLLLVPGNLVTGRFFQALAERLPNRFRIVAPDLRSFGRTAALPVDSSRGLRDWSDDVRSLVEALGWAGSGRIHAAGWSMGGGILQQYEIDYPADLASLTLIAPLSPFGFGGTRDIQGTPSYADFAGSGGGTAAPDFVRRLAARDGSEDEPTSGPPAIM